jgi:hypothetical protein
LQDGKEHVTKRYFVVAPDGEKVGVPDVAQGDVLRSDVLLVTRLPGAEPGADVVVLAGLHGPAIRSIKQLLFDIEVPDLEFLAEKVRGFPFPYYQATFRVDGLIESNGTTVPTSISLVRDTVQRVKLLN